MRRSESWWRKSPWHRRWSAAEPGAARPRPDQAGVANIRRDNHTVATAQLLTRPLPTVFSQYDANDDRALAAPLAFGNSPRQIFLPGGERLYFSPSTCHNYRMVTLPDDYPQLLENLKARIQQAQIKAALAVNRELVLLYWQIGKEILERQAQQGWGAKVIDRLSNDLRREFPSMKGLSRTNLLYMRSFSSAWPDEAIVQQLAGQIPWFHNCVLLDKVKDPQKREWYIRKTLENGWSRNVLVHHIDSRLYEREGKAITNFADTLPAPQSDLAQQLVKDPYHLDFVGLTQDAKERDLETALVTHIRDFLLELGEGFAFVGSQYPLKVGGEDFYLDLLFYYIPLRCYIIIELKATAFKPEYSGKMNFYLNVVDDLIKTEHDNPSIGIILCKAKNKVSVESDINGNGRSATPFSA